ncbi:Pkinase-domain-containing protein [Rickenella mellea]|uniref:Pkinase-domain-containing protein n=1 Tax=Rickenella mellea TaxID=50990 RepID=A0A4R5XEE4_9AGAM|nr:Pkinase-domain-containing protein [Rickenella mellea]
MPTGGVVIDAFKNLMRHGKPHHDKPSQGHDTTTRQRDRASDRQLETTQRQQQKAATLQDKQDQMDATRAQAEKMLQAEKESKSKMPTYKGLEKFKLLDKMGDGAFSNVYKAADVASGQKVAVKVVRKFELNASQDGNKHLNPQFKKRPRVTERTNILKEVQIMRGTNHPGIVKLLSFSESDEHYFLVLELMEGGELFHQIVKLTYFSENLSRHVILQVAQGIRYLHEERGVVHRDIKPENLLFARIPIVPSKHPVQRQYDEEKEDEGEFTPGVGGGGIGRVKIADFGLSKVVWNEETQTPCGTVGYTAPEIVKDERYSKSVDMWALGCVLYTLLCGFPPFYDESINVLTEKVARGYYTFLSPWWDDISSSGKLAKLSPSKDLITHLLCVDPAQRYTIDEFLAHPWCHEAPAPPPPPTPRVMPFTSRPLDSPLLAAARGGREVRSPGLATLKEAFDITYAVHRMEEEGARRRAYNGPGGAGTRGFLHGLNEEDEDEDEEDEITLHEAKQKQRVMEEAARKDASTRTGRTHARSANPNKEDRHLNEGRAGPRDRAPGTKGFELDIHGATLLERRHRRGAANAPNTSSPLSKEPAAGTENRYTDFVDAPQSPMHLG